MELFTPSKVVKYHMGPSKRTANLSLRIRACAVTVLDAAQEEFAVSDSKITMVLKLLKQSHKSLQMEPFMDKYDWDADRKTRDHSVKIILYANEDNMEHIGDILSEHSLFLQEPAQFQPFTDIAILMSYQGRIWLAHPDIWQLQRKPFGLKERLRAFCTASVQPLLVSLQQDDRIRTALQGYGHPILVLIIYTQRLTSSFLHSHQLAALQFMVTREEGIVDGSALSLWKPRTPFGEQWCVFQWSFRLSVSNNSAVSSTK